MQLHALELLFEIFYTLASKNLPEKIADNWYGKSKAGVLRNLSTVTAPNVW